MEPYIANAQNSRRQELLEKRLSERLNAICIPQLLPLIGGNDIPMAQSMVQAQLRNLRQTEPHLLSRATDFLSKVILERSKVVLQEHEDRSRQSTLLARDHLISTQPTETELLRRTMKSEIISRFSKLTNALRREDRMQTGTLSPNSIRMLCRQFNLESATLDNALAACYLDAKGGGNIQYGPLVEMLMNKDYPDLFREDLDAEGGIMLGRSSLRRRQDGASGTMRIRPVPVDEWAVLTKNNNEIANAYEQQIDESKRREACNYGQQLRLSGQTRRQQQDQMVRTRKQKEKEEEDRKLQNYREEQQRIQERQAQIELSAWQEGQAQIRYKAERVKMTKDQEMADAKARVRKNNQDAENEYLNQMAKTQNERAEWRESLKQNIVQQQNKELLIQQERVDDFKRQEVYAEMLEKEHIARMGALESALSYQPPPSSIRAAEGITAKAKADEARAYRIQRLREAEANEADSKFCCCRIEKKILFSVIF